MMVNNVNKTNGSNVFFRANYKRLLNFLRLMVIVNLILVAVFIYLFTHIPPAKAIASYEGKNAPLLSLSFPLVSQKALLDWASQAAISVYNLDYVNYRKEMKQTAIYFTPSGWKLFQNDFEKILNEVITKKLRVSAVVTDAPVIIEQGPLLGYYSWKIRMPILVSYESASETRYQSLIVDMVVVRVPGTMSTKGIAIAQFFSG